MAARSIKLSGLTMNLSRPLTGAANRASLVQHQSRSTYSMENTPTENSSMRWNASAAARLIDWTLPRTRITALTAMRVRMKRSTPRLSRSSARATSSTSKMRRFQRRRAAVGSRSAGPEGMRSANATAAGSFMLPHVWRPDVVACS